MTEKLYYKNAYLKKFDAEICKVQELEGGKIGIILNQTLFSPRGGGQPGDIGSIHIKDKEYNIIDVVENDGEIVHICNKIDSVLEGQINGVINWDRRFDIMQQHTGQHILSQSFLQNFGKDSHTSGFQIFDDKTKIEIIFEGELLWDELHKVEYFANRIIFENRKVETKITHRNDFSDYEINKLRDPLPDKEEIRIVEVESFDADPCGGLHCSMTGEVGFIKIIDFNKKTKNIWRIEFLCGFRALNSFQKILHLNDDINRVLNVPKENILKRINELLEKSSKMEKEIESYKSILLDYEIEKILENATKIGDIRIIKNIYENRSFDEIKQLSYNITKIPNIVIVFAGRSEKAYIIGAMSENLTFDLNKIISEASKILGGGAGGSRTLIKGGGPRIDKIKDAADLAFEMLKKELDR